MSFFKKRRLKRHAKDMTECVLLSCKRILEQGWEFQGDPTKEQLNSVYVQNVRPDEYLGAQSWGLWTAFEGGAMSLELAKNQIVLPLLCAYTPPHVSGEILMCHFAHELARLEDDENMRETAPDPELSTIWRQIAPDVIGVEAYNLTFKDDYPDKRFKLLSRTIAEIYEDEDFQIITYDPALYEAIAALRELNKQQLKS